MCELQALGPPRTDDAKAAAAAWDGEAQPLKGVVGDAELVVVGLFGAGLDRPLGGEAARLARASSAGSATASSPSTCRADSRATLAGRSARTPSTPALTVTFHRRKLVHVLQPGRERCGEVVVADIGLGDIATSLFENAPELWLAKFPWPKATAHKHTRGRLIVVSGEAWRTGAARLAARAGLRIGAGLVTVLSPPDALAVNAAHLEAVMLAPFETDQELAEAAEAAEAAVIGPAAGVNDETLANVLALARTGAALVIDADALTVFRDDPDELFSVLDRDDVLTPHPGEFERVFPGLLKLGEEQGGGGARGRPPRRRGGAGEGRGHRDRRAGRTCGGEHERRSLARHRRLRRRAGRLHRRAAGARHGELRGRLRGGLDPRRGGCGLRSRIDRRGPAGPCAEGARRPNHALLGPIGEGA